MILTNTFKLNKWQPLFADTAKCFAVAGVVILPISTSFTDIFLSIALITMLLAGNVQRTFKTIWDNPIAKLFIFYFLLFVLGSTYSSAPIHDSLKSLLKNSKLLYGALLIPLFLEAKWRDRTIMALIISMTVVMVLSYAGYFTLIKTQYHNAAIFKSYIQTNFLMAFYAYLVLGKAIDSKKHRSLFFALFFFAMINTLFLSHGRSGYLVFASLMGLFGWQRYSWKGLLIMIAMVSMLCTGAYFGSKTFQMRMHAVVTEPEQYEHGHANTSIGKRLTFYKDAITLIKDKPIIGSGTGSVITRIKEIEPNPMFQTHNVHNEYLNVGIQLGLVGMGFLLFFFTSIWLKSFTMPRDQQYLAQATLLAIAVGCLMNSWLMDTTQGHFFAVMLALNFSSPLAGEVK